MSEEMSEAEFEQLLEDVRAGKGVKKIDRRRVWEWPDGPETEFERADVLHQVIAALDLKALRVVYDAVEDWFMFVLWANKKRASGRDYAWECRITHELLDQLEDDDLREILQSQGERLLGVDL